jgi:hypothetical protein
MQFYAEQLRKILEKQESDVAVYDADSFTRGHVSPRLALKLVAGGRYVGIGSVNRIRAVRPLRGSFEIRQLHQASRTTERIRNEAGDLCAADWVREHRRCPPPKPEARPDNTTRTDSLSARRGAPR